jgi:hypothetical protein
LFVNKVTAVSMFAMVATEESVEADKHALPRVSHFGIRAFMRLHDNAHLKKIFDKTFALQRYWSVKEEVELRFRPQWDDGVSMYKRTCKKAKSIYSPFLCEAVVST